MVSLSKIASNSRSAFASRCLDKLFEASAGVGVRGACEVVAFFRAHRIDAVLVEPPFTAALARDDHFAEVVAAISARARENEVVLIRRSVAMRYVAEQQAERGEGLNFSIAVTIAPLSMSGWWCGSRWSASRGPSRSDRCRYGSVKARQQASGVETRST